jgi:desulfoferrodoxin (superoxide reductase-like protein)
MTKKIVVSALCLLLWASTAAFANKTAVSLDGPESAAAGTEITLTVTVSHKGNSGFHYTNWVVVKADGEEIARWDFKSSDRPESENFTREIKYTVEKTVEITAQGNCNIHGSEGPAVLKITVE